MLQWNCRSLISASIDLNCLTTHLNPDVIILQETWLTPEKNFNFKDFRLFRLDRLSLGGGLMILLSSKFCHKAKIAFKLMSPECEILAVHLSIPGYRTFSIINAYFPTGVHSTYQLDSALASCKNQVILTGDFNSHHVSWGYRTDACGTRLWDWTIDKNLSCLNMRRPTFVRGQSRSVLDLTFSSTSIAVTSWTTIDFSTNSDHLPVYFEIACPLTSVERQDRIFVNCKKFKDCLHSSIASLTNTNDEDIGLKICSALQMSRQKSEFVIQTAKRTSSSPWWNNECSRVYRRRKAAWKKLLHNQSPQNWKDYQFISATFKRTVKHAKDEYDKKHFDYLSESKNKRALFYFLRSRNRLPLSVNVDSIVYTAQEMQESLDLLAKGLESRFTTRLQNSVLTPTFSDYKEISYSELAQVMLRLPTTAPGPDGITNAMLKIFFQEAPRELLKLLNYSISNAWIPHEWKIAKIIPLLKKQGAGYTIDNIRPIALTSNIAKLIERVLHGHIMKFIDENQLLSPCQIGFRSGYSIWHAHVDLESRINIARQKKQYAALVTLDICKAYDSIEHAILTNRLQGHGFPGYIVAWVHEFLKDREFFCFRSGYSSGKHKQTRGVPQGSVLSPILFNILLSGIPVHPGVSTYVYADDIAFFGMASDLYSLYEILQSYLKKLEGWLDSLHLNLNANKCAILVFPVKDPVYISLNYHLEDIPQVQSLKYLGVIYNGNLNWRPHIEYLATKGARTMGILRKLSNRRTGMRRKSLLMVYKMYVRPVLEFGCVLFSGVPSYKLRPLVLLEREALRLCLGLPKYVANAVLYLEARIPPIICRFHLLTVQTFLRLYESPLSRPQIIFISDPQLFFPVHWPRFHTPQIIFVQKLLEPLNVQIRDVLPNNTHSNYLDIRFDDIFPNHAKLLPYSILNAMLQDHLSSLGTNIIIATDASQSEEKTGIGIFCPALDWSFSLRLPDFVPIFLAEFLAVILALRKLDQTTTTAAILTDSLSVCSSLTATNDSPMLKLFYLLVPAHVQCVHLIWVPGHKGLFFNETADSLAKTSLSGPVLPILPVTAHITAARFRMRSIRKALSNPVLTASPDYKHLIFPWRSESCNTKMLEVSLTKLRCRIPSLNFYLHRSGLVPSPLCPFCNEEETIHHFLLSCRRFTAARKRLLEIPFRRLGLDLTEPNILSFGASTLGFSHRDACFAVQTFLTDSKRIPC